MYNLLSPNVIMLLATISSLENDLLHSTIDKLSLQVKQLSIPFGSEEALFLMMRKFYF